MPLFGANQAIHYRFNPNASNRFSIGELLNSRFLVFTAIAQLIHRPMEQTKALDEIVLLPHVGQQ